MNLLCHLEILWKYSQSLKFTKNVNRFHWIFWSENNAQNQVLTVLAKNSLPIFLPKPLFWAYFAPKRNQQDLLISNPKNAPKVWRALTLKMLALVSIQTYGTFLQQLPKPTDLWFDKFSKQRKSPFSVRKNVEVLQITWLKR